MITGQALCYSNINQELHTVGSKKINWNKYQSSIRIQKQNEYLDYLTDPNFQKVNRLFVLSFDNNAARTEHREHFLPFVQIKDYNVMIDCCTIFDQPLKNDLRTNDTIRKIATGQSDNYATGCLVNYAYFKENCKTIVIDLSKHKALNADPKAIQ